MSTALICPACGASLVAGPARCPQCGAALARRGAAAWPDRVPLWAGLTAGACATAYVMAQTFAEARWGAPSSTSALGFIAAPIVGIVVGIVGSLVGLGLRAGLRSRGAAPASAPKWIVPGLWLVVLVVAAVSLVSARSYQLRLAEFRRPRVILDLGHVLTAAPQAGELQSQTEAPELQSGLTNTLDAHPIDWNGTAVKVTDADGQIAVTGPNGARLATADLQPFDGVSRLHAMTVCQQADGRSMLAVLASLRATARRAMLLVFAADGRLVYQQHLARAGGAKDALYAGRLNGVDAVRVSLGADSVWTCSQ